VIAPKGVNKLKIKPMTKADVSSLLSTKNLNDFTWGYCDKGLHVFSKRSNKGYEVIKAKDEDLTNGNIEYFTQHGISR